MNPIKHIPTIIVGAGPSGTTCGYLLAKAGHRSLIIDKINFPREKTCGGGLTPKAHKLIDEIFKNIGYEYLPIHKLNFCTGKGTFISFDLTTEIRNIVRHDFDKILLDEYIKSGGDFMVARIRKIEEREKKIFLHLSDGQILSCDTLVGADGANSIVKKYLQPVPTKKILILEKTNTDSSLKEIDVYFDKKYDCGYMYVFPNRKGSIAGYGHKRATLKEFEEEIRRLGLNDEGKTKGAYCPAFGKFGYPFKKNILLIGDAGEYVDSVTCEGLYYAVKTGQNAAISIINGEDFSIVNARIINRIKKLQHISAIFYNACFQRIFIKVCSLKYFHNRLNRIANFYIGK